MSRPEILGLDRRKVVLSIGVALVLVLGAGTLVARAADFDEITAALRAADKSWLVLCLAGLVCAYAGYILGYRAGGRAHARRVVPALALLPRIARLNEELPRTRRVRRAA